MRRDEMARRARGEGHATGDAHHRGALSPNTETPVTGGGDGHDSVGNQTVGAIPTTVRPDTVGRKRTRFGTKPRRFSSASEASEIGPEMVRSGQANSSSATSFCTSVQTNIRDGVSGDDGHVVRGNQLQVAIVANTGESPRKRSIYPSTPNGRTTASQQNSPGNRAGGEGQPPPVARAQSALATPVSQLFQQLVNLQKSRVMTIKEVNGSVSRIEHLLVGQIGHDGTEKTRKAAFARARAYRLAVERGGEGHIPDAAYGSSALSAYDPLIVQSAISRKQWPMLREDFEKDMVGIAKQLPAADYVAKVKGLGWLGFAVVCAESIIPLAEWRTVSGLWKHMGFAVIDGRRQQGISGKRKNAEEAMKMFHPKERRGQLYGFLQDSLFRAQWNAGKLNCALCGKPTKFEWKEDIPICDVCDTPGFEDDVVSAHAAGHYGEVYERRRAHTAARVLETDDLDGKDPMKWTAKRCHSDATRVMAKALLRDLWRVSRGLPPRRLHG